MAAKDAPQEAEQSGWDQQIAANLLRLRTERGLSTTRLSALLKEVGQAIPATGITRIEKGQRRVSAADLAALAIVLRVSPLTLLLPWTDDPDSPVEVAGVGRVTADQLWRWADGYEPLVVSETDPEGDIQRHRLDSRPVWARMFLRYVKYSEIAEAMQEREREAVQRRQELEREVRDLHGPQDWPGDQP